MEDSRLRGNKSGTNYDILVGILKYDSVAKYYLSYLAILTLVDYVFTSNLL